MGYIKTEKLPGRQRNRPLKDYAGQKFGRLLALSLIERASNGTDHKWQFQCDCGRLHTTSIKSVRGGHTSSCGCIHSEVLSERNRTHGKSHLREYKVWKDMRARCGNRRNKEYPNYGGRGIEVCDRWKKFENFLADMGVAPAGTTIDRRDVNGHYNSANCWWAPADDQANNKRTTRRITLGGETKSLAQWCRHFGISRSRVGYRLKSGIPVERAFSLDDFRR